MTNLVTVLIPLVVGVGGILAATRFHKLRKKAREKGVSEGVWSVLAGEIICAIIGGFAVAVALLLIMTWIAISV